MTEHARCINIDAEAWRRELQAIGWDIMQAEPMAALRRIDRMVREITKESHMDPDKINVTAYGSQEEPWRLIRLARIVGYVCALDDAILDKVERLHDHKGLLKVNWRSPPSAAEMRLL